MDEKQYLSTNLCFCKSDNKKEKETLSEEETLGIGVSNTQQGTTEVRKQTV